jgi:LPXTG-site transpeptidase (sortase) family protein
MLVFGCGLIAYGASGFLRQYIATHNPKPVIPAQAVTHSTDTPDETRPAGACVGHKASVQEPRKIDIPHLGISGCIQKVGIDQHKAIAVPSNIHVAGWYINSVPPGEKGLSIIDGHVRGRYNDAIFRDLHRLRSGDHFKIQMGDESWRQFEVVRVESYPLDKATTELFTRLDGAEHQLTLITCGGAYDSKTKTYDQRVIVRSRLIPG